MSVISRPIARLPPDTTKPPRAFLVCSTSAPSRSGRNLSTGPRKKQGWLNGHRGGRLRATTLRHARPWAWHPRVPRHEAAERLHGRQMPCAADKLVDGRAKPGHDGGEGGFHPGRGRPKAGGELRGCT